MSENEPRASTPRLHDRLETIVDLLRRREGLLAFAGAAPDGDEAALEAADAELQARLDDLHPADLADVLESLPLEDRLAIWQRVRSDRDGDILLEVSRLGSRIPDRGHGRSARSSPPSNRWTPTNSPTSSTTCRPRCCPS